MSFMLTCGQSVNVISGKSVIQWEYKGGRKTDSRGMLEDWAWRVEVRHSNLRSD